MIRVNGVEEPWLHESVVEMLTRLQIEPRGIAVACNGEIVRRSEWASFFFNDGDQIEVVTAAAGG